MQKKIGTLISILLMMLFVLGCTNLLPGLAKETLVTPPSPRRQIVQNDLPIDLVWSKSVTNGQTPPNRFPLACYQNYGAIISVFPDEPELQGAALFNHDGNVLWNHSEDRASAVTLDEKAVYIFDAPMLKAYDIQSGELLWETDEGLGFRFFVSLFAQDGEIQLVSDRFIHIYQKSDGQLVSRDHTLYENLVLQNNDSYLYIDGNSNLFATSTSNHEDILWFNEKIVAGRTPQVYDNSLITYSDTNQPVCRVRLNDGHVIWCENKRILSNIAVHNGLGYGINTDFEIVAFQLEDGKDIGKVVFMPESPSPSEIFNQFSVATCNDHLLVYFPWHGELLWFDFAE